MAGEQQSGAGPRDRRKRIGRLGQQTEHVAHQYQSLAADDETIGRGLLEGGAHRQATYLFVQAMEKYVRARIFSTINASHAVLRQRAQTHDLMQLLDFLIEIVSTRPEVRAHVKAQVRDFVLDGVRFHELHNDLRYPIPIRGGEVYATLQVDRRAAEIVLERLDALKNFLRDMDRLTH